MQCLSIKVARTLMMMSIMSQRPRAEHIRVKLLKEKASKMGHRRAKNIQDSNNTKEGMLCGVPAWWQ
jgi:hypothetical protein